MAAAEPYALIPLSVQEISQLIRTVALVVGAVVIPWIIWLSGRRREDQAQQRTKEDRTLRATLNLIHRLTGDLVLMERASRVYRYRMSREASPGAIDPYVDVGHHGLVHDCVVILNINDAACIEILTEKVDEELLYQTCRDAIIGVETVLTMLNDILDMDNSKLFPHLVTVIRRWRFRAEEEDVTLAPQLTGGQGPGPASAED